MTTDALSAMLENLTFQPEGVGMACLLGPLEARVMEVTWEEGETTIRAIHQRLGGADHAAYTTVATVAHRLEEKGLLARRHAGRTLLLRPTMQRPDFQAVALTRVLHGALRQLRTTRPGEILAHLSVADRSFLRRALDQAEAPGTHAGGRT